VEGAQDIRELRLFKLFINFLEPEVVSGFDELARLGDGEKMVFV
jgi:hypothetical protein